MRFFLGLLTFLSLIGSGAHAQKVPLPRDVFVLVDVSGSMVGANYGIGHGKVLEAKNLVRDLLADSFDWSRYANWQSSLLAPEIEALTSQAANRTPLLQSGSRLFLKRFGDPASSKTPSIERLINVPVRDIDALFASFPAVADFDDQRTFLWLARAKTRQEALARGLTAYLLVEITDAREDKENIVDTEDQIAVREFKNVKHVLKNGEIGSFSHRQTRGEYVLQVNLRLIRLAGDTGGNGTSASGLVSNLKLPKGLREGDDALVSWDSFNATGTQAFTVTLTPPGGTPISQKTPRSSMTFTSVKAGNHSVSVLTPSGSVLQGEFEVAPAGSAPVVEDDPSGPSEILLQSPRKDAEITSGSVTVSWRVVNPPQGCKYLVTVTGPPGTKIPKKTVDGTRASFSLRKSGPYRVRVAATARGVKPAAGTFHVKNQGGRKALYALLALLPIAIVVIAAIKHAKKRRHGQDEFEDYSDNLD